MVMNDKKNKNSYKYGFMLYEELAKKIGIDIISKKKLDEYCQNDIIKVPLHSYLKYRLKILDENTGKRARTVLQEDIFTDIELLEKALSIDLSEEDIEKLMKNLKSIYILNAISSTDGNDFYDWDLIIAKGSQCILGLYLKEDNKEWCNLHYPHEMIKYAYEALNQNEDSKFLPEYINEINERRGNESKIYDRMDNFIDTYYEQPIEFKECIKKATSIDPKEIIKEVEEENKISLPELYNWWFCKLIDNNKEYLESQVEAKTYKH